MYNRELLMIIDHKKKIDEQTNQAKLQRLSRYETLDFPIWKRMKVKDTQVPEYKAYNNQKILFHQVKGLSVKPLQGFLPEIAAKFMDHAYGASEKHRLLTEVFSNAGSYIEVGEGVIVEEPIVLQYHLNKENPLLLDHNILYVKKSSEVTIVLDYTDDHIKGFHNGVLNVIAEENAIINVIKCQNYGIDTTHIFSGIALIARDAKVTYQSVDLGAGLTVTDYSSYLEGENGDSHVESVYLGDGERKLDLGYNTYHQGRRTVSDVIVKGALLDASRKVFRGNLFFARGAKRAKGSEQEYVILLDPRVQADSIPALMCDEDDVQGEHAASAGQIADSKLFYLMSRGLSEKESKQLIIMASFAPIINKLPIDGLKTRIEEEVRVRLNQDLKSD